MRFPAWLVVPGFLMFMPALPAADYVLTIGGGHTAQNNQVSLEKNVLFFGRVLAEQLPDATHTILFADGDDPRRDLQYVDPEVPPPRVDALLARIFNQTQYFAERYRDHEIPQVDGAATRENLSRWFDRASETLVAGDRVILYATAHGGRSEDRKRLRNTTLYLWNDEITVAQLAGELDKLSPEVAVVVVMVQCYAGGFADLIFTDADLKNGPTAHNRCGFYATSPTRVAAGCTPDIDEADYHEYSSSFWAAILGRTRTGASITDADYDADGRVSFAEAHAFVLLDSDTIDVPLKTSEVLLRATSSERPRNRPAVAARSETTDPNPAGSDGEPARQVTALRPIAPLTSRSPVSQLQEAAGPVEKQVIDGLSEQLELAKEDRADEAREVADAIEDERKRLRSRIRRLERDYHDIRKTIETEVLAEWPELAGTWNPAGRRIVAEQPDAVIQLIEAHPDFQAFNRLAAEIVRLEKQRLDLERRWVKCQRLIQTLESVALAHNLPLIAEPHLIARYEQLLAAENATLAPAVPEN